MSESLCSPMAVRRRIKIVDIWFKFKKMFWSKEKKENIKVFCDVCMDAHLGISGGRYYGPGRCPECDGRKWRPTYYQDGELSIDEDCYECDGTGLSVDAQIAWQDLAKNVELWVWK